MQHKGEPWPTRPTRNSHSTPRRQASGIARNLPCGRTPVLAASCCWNSSPFTTVTRPVRLSVRSPLLIVFASLFSSPTSSLFLIFVGLWRHHIPQCNKCINSQERLWSERDILRIDEHVHVHIYTHTRTHTLNPTCCCGWDRWGIGLFGRARLSSGRDRRRPPAFILRRSGSGSGGTGRGCYGCRAGRWRGV